jgi:hypothetical protein
LIVLCLVPYYYINKVLLPLHFKDFVEHKIEDALDHDVTLGGIHADLFRGFVLTNVVIWENEERKQYLLKIPQATFKILFIPFLKEHNIVLPSIKLINPVIKITRDKDGVWNLSELARKHSDDQKKAPEVFLRKFVIRNGNIALTDDMHETPVHQAFTRINLQASVSLDRTLKFSGSVESSPKSSFFKTYGIFDIINKNLTARVVFKNINIASYLPIFFSSSDIKFNNGLFSSSDMSIGYADGKTSFNGTILCDNLQKQTKQQLK